MDDVFYEVVDKERAKRDNESQVPQQARHDIYIHLAHPDVQHDILLCFHLLI